MHDCIYLALAEREQVPLVTADTRMLERVRQPDAAEGRLAVISADYET